MSTSDYLSLTVTNDQSIGLLHEKGRTMSVPAFLTFTVIYNETEKISFL